MKFIKFLFVLFAFSSFGQGTFYGNHVIDVYGGLPNMDKYFANVLSTTNQTISSYKGLPPSGIRYSFMLTDNISLGLDVIYNYNTKVYLDTDTLFVNGNWQYVNTETTNKEKRLRVQARMNFFIPNNIPEFDTYFGVGLGTNNRWVNKYQNNALVESLKGGDAALLPFSMRVCYGIRYYFSYNFGFNAEVGLGGPLLSFGLSYKI